MKDSYQLNGDHPNGVASEDYSVPGEASKVFHNATLSNPLISKDLPDGINEAANYVHFTGSQTPSLPIPYRFSEAVSAIKALEASLLNILINKKYGTPMQDVTIDTDHATLFIMSTLLWTIDPSPGGANLRPAGLRGAEGLEKYFPDYSKEANFTPYRNLVTNIYECKDGRFYHFHNSLNPDPTLQALGLPRDMDIASYEDGVNVFREKVKGMESEELDRMYNEEYRQAGTICYSSEEFLSSEHGRANSHVGLWEIHSHPNELQKPCWWPDSPQTGPKRPLAGLKVVDLTRIIAAPCVTRSLAEMGASVMRVTAPHLPDISSLHVDLNWGKWNCHLDLREEEDRAKLRALIEEADIIVQGYRPGVLDKFGFGREDIIKLVEKRERGLVYVRENCYGWNGPWSGRSGWQQISDANTGISHGFGVALGHGEPVTPIFPHSDYCTGISGSCAILIALLHRSVHGGSYSIDLALNYYNTWLIRSVGKYPPAVFKRVWEECGKPVYQSWHNNGFTVPDVMKRLKVGEGAKRLFQERFWEERKAPVAMGDEKKVIRCLKPIAQWNGSVELGYNVGARGNGVDAPRWPEDLMTERVL